MKKFHLITLSLFLSVILTAACSKDTANAAPPANSGTPTVMEQKIRITIGNSTMTAIVYDNPTSRSFLSQLPLTVDMNDFAGTEKIFYPPQHLNIDNNSKGMNPATGDIAVYAPWGNIALFYHRGGTFSNDLIPLGHLESGIDAFSTGGTITGVRLEIAGTRNQSNP